MLLDGGDLFLEKSFKASAKGCNTPLNPTLVGPLRCWAKAKILRSNKVKNATITKHISKKKVVWMNIIISLLLVLTFFFFHYSLFLLIYTHVY